MRSEGYCSWVCVCVCHISPMERLFVMKTLSRSQRTTTVKMYVGFSLKPLRCRDPALPPLCGRAYSRPFFLAESTHAYGPRPALCFPVLVLAYNYISAAARLFAFATSSGCASPVYLLMLAVWEKLLTGIHCPWARVPAT